MAHQSQREEHDVQMEIQEKQMEMDARMTDNHIMKELITSNRQVNSQKKEVFTLSMRSHGKQPLQQPSFYTGKMAPKELKFGNDDDGYVDGYDDDHYETKEDNNQAQIGMNLLLLSLLLLLIL